MAFFKSKPQRTADNLGPDSTSKGVVGGLIFCNQTNDSLVWKYPYMDIKKGAVVKVHENQKAVLFDGGKLAAVLEPGRDVVVNANNIPYLSKFLNSALGGDTSYPLEIWFVNTTVEHTVKWGFGPSSGCKVPDPSDPEMRYTVTGFGSYRFRVATPETFLRKLVGTQHIATEENVMEFFKDESISAIASFVQEVALTQQLSPADLGGKRLAVQDYVREYLNKAWQDQYGVEITSMIIAGLTSPEFDNYLAEMQSGNNLRKKFDRQGRYYDAERQYEIAQEAVRNPGAGNVMGAAMGVGMGFNMGSGIGQMIGGAFGNVDSGRAAPGPGQPQSQAVGSVPPPIPGTGVLYHVAVNGQPTGPFPLPELTKKVIEGSLQRETLVWCPGMTNWTEAGKVADLQALFIQTPPPIV